MKETLTLFFAFILIYGCNIKSDKNQGNVKTNEVKDKTLTTIVEQKSNSKQFLRIFDQLELGCYYELDDKYSDSKNEKEIENWWGDKLKSIEETGIQNNILSKDAGGPNGAEWNTYTDLYFVLVIPTKIHAKESIDLRYDSIAIAINDKPVNYNKRQSDNKVILADFMLEKEIWTSALRSIEPEDYVPLFGKERVEKAKMGDIPFIAPMNTGKIFEINIDIRLENGELINLKEFFHIAYGE